MKIKAISIYLILIIFTFSFCSVMTVSTGFDEKSKLFTSEIASWPTSAWSTSLPEDQGINSQKLEDMDNFINNNDLYFYIDSLLIVRNGYLVYESYPSQIYDENEWHHIYSCTKVFTSALIGIALEEGLIGSLDDHVLDYFPDRDFENLNAWKQSITIRNLLTMTSGIEWTDQVNFYQMAGTSDWIQYILDQPMACQPGTVWNYNTGCSHLLAAILENVTALGTLDYAETKLFSPMNITNYSWQTDPSGIPIGGTLLHVTPRDMAKFGYLYLHEGDWNGTQLIPSDWVDESTQASMSLEFDQGHGSGYGYQWWTYRWFNAYTARGSYEQYITVIPDIGMVVIATGNHDYSYINLLANYILPSAGFVPIDFLFLGGIIFGSTILCAVSILLFLRTRKKVEIRKLKKKYLDDFPSEQE